jgi:hypothetical protein
MWLSDAISFAKCRGRRAALGVILASACLAWAIAAIVATGQGTAQNSQSYPANQEPLARVNVDLVQMDVIVTDAKGNHITDLRPEEFEMAITRCRSRLSIRMRQRSARQRGRRRTLRWLSERAYRNGCC